MPEQRDFVLTNARIVLADRVIGRGWLAVSGGTIAEFGEGDAPERGDDLSGDLLLPGLVELHTDHLEAHYSPRPKVYWDPVAAVVSFDGQLATSGITTVLELAASLARRRCGRRRRPGRDIGAGDRRGA